MNELLRPDGTPAASPLDVRICVPKDAAPGEAPDVIYLGTMRLHHALLPTLGSVIYFTDSAKAQVVLQVTGHQFVIEPKDRAALQGSHGIHFINLVCQVIPDLQISEEEVEAMRASGMIPAEGDEPNQA